MAAFYDDKGVSRFYDGTILDGNGIRNVPKLILGTIADVMLGDEYQRCDYKREPDVRGPWDRRRGLKNFVRIEKNGIPVYVVDEHHHALLAWVEGKLTNFIRPKARLIHIDDHDDYNRFDLKPLPMGVPKRWDDLQEVTKFVTSDLDEGHFIGPAIKHHIIHNGVWLRPEGRDADWDNRSPNMTSQSLDWEGLDEWFAPKNEGKRILDIDVDYFRPHTDGGSPFGIFNRTGNRSWSDLFEADVEKIRSLIPRSDLVTISIPSDRSYLEPEKGIEIAKRLLE